MSGKRAAGTAAGLAPRGGRGLRWLRSGPPPPPQAPAPAPAAAGRCGMGRVARYIPGAPGLGPARPRRRQSAHPPASPEVQKSLRPATVLHLRNAPKNKPLGAQLASLCVTHASIRQSQAAAGPWHHAHSRYQPIARRKSDTPAPPPALSQHPLTLGRQLITAHQSRLPSQDANGRSQGDFRGLSRACQSPTAAASAPIQSLAGAPDLPSRRCGPLQSQLRPEAPPTAPPLLGCRALHRCAGWRCSPRGLL